MSKEEPNRFEEIAKAIRAGGDRYNEEKTKLTPEFNAFEMIKMDEMRISRMIAWLLNPEGSHEQGNTFLNLFIEKYNNNTILKKHRTKLKKSKKVLVYKEYKIDENTDKGKGRIDILLEFELDDDKKFGIVIENKPFADDQEEQIWRYKEYIENKYDENYFIIYMPGEDEVDPSTYSIKTKDLKELKTNGRFKTISIPEIKPWIEQCAEILKDKKANRASKMVKEFAEYINKQFNNTNSIKLSMITEDMDKNILDSHEIQRNWNNGKQELLEGKVKEKIKELEEMKKENCKLNKQVEKLEDKMKEEAKLVWKEEKEEEEIETKEEEKERRKEEGQEINRKFGKIMGQINKKDSFTGTWVTKVNSLFNENLRGIISEMLGERTEKWNVGLFQNGLQINKNNLSGISISNLSWNNIEIRIGSAKNLNCFKTGRKNIFIGIYKQKGKVIEEERFNDTRNRKYCEPAKLEFIKKEDFLEESYWTAGFKDNKNIWGYEQWKELEEGKGETITLVLDTITKLINVAGEDIDEMGQEIKKSRENTGNKE